MIPTATSSSKSPYPVVHYHIEYICQGVPVRAMVTNLTAAFLEQLWLDDGLAADLT